MTKGELETAVLRALSSVAPEVGPGTIRPNLPFRDQVDLDSFDYLNFMIALRKECGVEVPEADYPKLSTLGGAVEYLAARLGP